MREERGDVIFSVTDEMADDGDEGEEEGGGNGRGGGRVIRGERG